MKTFAREEIWPSWLPNALDASLKPIAENFRIVKTSSTTIQVPAAAGAGNDRVTIVIDGLWRYRDTSVSRAHPGGAAGEYDVYVTCKSNQIDPTPQPNTDNTDYSFDLAITADAVVPTVVPGTVDHFRKVADITWDGAKITSVRPIVADSRPSDPIEPTPSTVEDTAVRMHALAGQTGDLWQSVSSTGAVRRAERADGSLYAIVAGASVADESFLATGHANPAFRRSGSGKLEWGAGAGSALDTTLRRSNVAELTTDGSLVVAAALSAASAAVSGNATIGGTLGVTGLSTLASLGVTNNATVGGTLSVTGVSTHTGQLRVADGSAATPGLAFTAATDMGLYRSGTTLGWAIGGASKMTLTTAGLLATTGGLSTTTGAFSGAVTVGTTLGVTGATTLAALSASTGTFSSTVDVGGMVRATGSSPAPASGAGVEAYYAANIGVVEAYDRTGAVYKPLVLDGTSVRFQNSGTEVARFDSGGLKWGAAQTTILAQPTSGTLDLSNSTVTGLAALRVGDGTNGYAMIWRDSSVGAAQFSGAAAYSATFGTNAAKPVNLATNSTVRFTIDSAGAATHTGAVTISGGLTVSAGGVTLSSGQSLVLATSQWSAWGASSDRGILTLGAPSYNSSGGTTRIILGKGGASDSRGMIELEGETGTLRFGAGVTATPDNAITRSGAGLLTHTNSTSTQRVATGYNSTGGTVYMGIEDSGGGQIFGGGGGTSAYAAVFGHTAARPIEFVTNGNRRMIIQSDGAVKINEVNAPTSRFWVTEDNASSQVIHAYHSSSTHATPVIAAETNRTDSTAYNLYIATNQQGGGGTTRFQVRGDGAEFAVSNNLISDRSLKTKVATLDDPLDRLLRLKPVSYEWKYKVHGMDKVAAIPRNLGFIAQDVEPIVPEAIDSTQDGSLTLNYSALLPVIVGGVQDLAKRVSALEAR